MKKKALRKAIRRRLSETAAEDTRRVYLRAPDPPPGQVSGDERYVSCDFCGFEGKPTKDEKVMVAQTKKHGPGICAE